jgi:hypothetical protein
VRRKEFGLPRGLHLWVAYNRNAVQNSAGLCRVVTSDSALLRRGKAELDRVYDELRACGEWGCGLPCRLCVCVLTCLDIRLHVYMCVCVYVCM